MDLPCSSGKKLSPHPAAAETRNCFQGGAGQLLNKQGALLSSKPPCVFPCVFSRSDCSFQGLSQVYLISKFCMRPASHLLGLKHSDKSKSVNSFGHPNSGNKNRYCHLRCKLRRGLFICCRARRPGWNIGKRTV